jgi:hypothetical protein
MHHADTKGRRLGEGGPSVALADVAVEGLFQPASSRPRPKETTAVPNQSNSDPAFASVGCAAASAHALPRRSAAAPAMVLLGLAAMLAPAVSIAAFMLHARPPVAAVMREELKLDSVRRPTRPVGPAAYGARLRGRVLDAEGAPVAQARVHLFSPHVSEPAASAEVETDFGGEFAFQLAAGEKVVQVRAERVGCGAVESAELDVPPSCAGVVRPDACQRTVVLVLPPRVALTGRISDGRGRPLPRAVARLSGGLPGSDQVAPVDQEGRYAFGCVAPGMRNLTTWAPGFAASTFELDVGSRAIEQDVRLRPAPAVRGVVVDPDGHPVSFARVTACSGKDKEEALSDEAGRFELPPLTMGCSARARHARFALSRPIRIASARAMTVQLEPGGAIDGVVTNGRGRRIGSFSVTLTSFDPAPGEVSEEAPVGESRAGLRGAFHWSNLVPGAYNLEVQAEGMTPWSSTIHVTSGKVARGVHAVLGQEGEATVVDPAVENAEPEGDTAVDESNGESDQSSGASGDAAEENGEAAEGEGDSAPAEGADTIETKE